MEENSRCVIWGTLAKENNTDRDGREIISPRAGGEYFISGTAEAMLENNGAYDYDHIRVHLTDWLVYQRRLGVRWPEITSKTIREAQQRRNFSTSDRTDNTLRYLSEKTKTPGLLIHYHALFDNNAQLGNSEKTYLELLSHSSSVGHEDLFSFLDYLKKGGLIEHKGIGSRRPHSCALTVAGDTRLAELKKTFVASSEAFVAMWFDPSMDDAWNNGFEPAICEAGYKPVRMDEHEHVNKIDDEIIAMIQRARFIVADFTHGDHGARGGVYYEAGFAHGLNIQVIFTCRKGFLKKVHLDTRQYNHIEWTEPEDLRKVLKKRIIKVFGHGPNKPPN